MLTRAIRYVAVKGTKGQTTATIQLACHVKPGAHANREGVTALQDDTIEVCVAAQARDGEANKAVRQVIADALEVPKSDVDVAKGTKSRDKTVIVTLGSASKEPDEEMERIKDLLLKSVNR